MKIQLEIITDSHNTNSTGQIVVYQGQLSGEVRIALDGFDRVITVKAADLMTAIRVVTPEVSP